MNKRKFQEYIMIPAIGFMILILVVFQLQFFINKQAQIDNSTVKLEIAENRIGDNKYEESKDWESYDSFMQSKSDMLAMMIDEMGSFDKKTLAEFADVWELSGLYVINDGNRLAAGSVELTQHTINKFKSGKTFDTDKDAGICFYASDLQDGSMLIIAQDSRRMLDNEDFLISVDNALSTIKVGSTGFVAAYERSESDEALVPAYVKEGSSFDSAEAVKTISGLSDGSSDWHSVGGTKYLITIKDIDDVRLVAAVPRSEIIRHVIRTVSIAAFIFGAALILLALYAAFLIDDVRRGKIGLATVRDKFRTISSIALIIVLVASFYTYMLSSISDATVKLNDKLDSVEYIIADSEQVTNRITNTYEDEYLARAQRIAYMLKTCPSLINNDKLNELARTTGLNSIYVFDGKGSVDATNTVFTDFKLSKDPGTQSYEFWNIVKGYDDYIIQDLREDDTVKHNLIQYIGVKRLDSKGMVQIGVTQSRLQERLYGDSINDVISNIAVEDKGRIFHNKVKKDTPKSHVGFINTNGTTEIALSKVIADNNVVVCKPVSTMIRNSLIDSIVITLLCGIILLILISRIIKHHLNDDIIYGNTADFTADSNSNRVAAADHLHHIAHPWHSLSAGEKLSKVCFAVFSLIVLIVVFVFRVFSINDNSIIPFIMSTNWDRGINVFSLTYVIIIAMEIIFLTSIARKLILALSVGNGSRTETIGRLLNSIIKYVAVIGTVFYCLHFLGVNSQALFASAGLLTLGISLGAQSLVGDILAGMFIIFEGDFRVGDIVSIDGFTGTVREIGIRTTKVESADTDLKIFSNSSISGVINMTRQYSYATINCGIAQSESIEQIEEILDNELVAVKSTIAEIVDGPYYNGISEFSDSSTVITISAQCHERDKAKVTTSLKRQVKKILDNHNIHAQYIK